MRVEIGTKVGGGQIQNSNDPVVVIEFHARSNNAQSVYVGLSDVATNNGRELPPGESFTLNFALPDLGRHAGSVLFSAFYIVTNGGDALDWAAIIRGD